MLFVFPAENETLFFNFFFLLILHEQEEYIPRSLKTFLLLFPDKKIKISVKYDDPSLYQFLNEVYIIQWLWNLKSTDVATVHVLFRLHAQYIYLFYSFIFTFRITFI